MPATTQTQLMQQLVELTGAVKALAQRPVDVDVDVDGDERERVSDADRVRQRVAFSYQALGTLTSRVSETSGAEFDVPVVAAVRGRGVIGFDGLPPGAGWVELRAGSRIEVLRIHRRDDEGHEPFPVPARGTLRRRHQGDVGAVRPQVFADADPVGSIVVLRNRRGPLLAFGPRLAPLTTEPVEID